MRIAGSSLITALDPNAFKAPKDKRLKMKKMPFETRADFAKAAKPFDKIDVVLDDATHTSHAQQYAFAEFFPKLKSGGLYIVEDLRFQPKDQENSGFPKTSGLFQGFVGEGGFVHPDEELQDDLNALRADISGCFIHQAHYHRQKRDQILVVHKR